MTYNWVMSKKHIILLISVLGLYGCDWVDSTGRGANSAPVTQISFEDGAPVEAVAMNELSSLLIEASSSDADGTVRNYKWSEQPVAEGALDQCAGVENFDTALAATTLQSACADGEDCGLTFVQESGSAQSVAEFKVSSPKLRAPVGVSYTLTATDNDGGTGTQQSTFCLIAINEAPTAVPDVFTILEGESLVVTASDRNLLSNDSDDDHILNQPLTVFTEPKKMPDRASDFTLQSDGGFIYVPEPIGSASGTNSDTFEYFLSDGVFNDTSTAASAEVTIRIVAVDDAPEIVAEVPTQVAVAGVPFSSDLSVFFADPEGEPLNFAVVNGSLPDSGGIALSSSGVLSGTAELFDEGSYVIEVAASDGNSGVTASVQLVIDENKPVITSAIAAQDVEAGSRFRLDVSNSFNDPEQQPLTYTVSQDYLGVDLTMNAETGVLTGSFTNPGRYTIDVSASDGVTEPESVRFVVNVTSNNFAPVFLGSIANRTATVNQALLPISGTFVDPDDDELVYSLVGTLPVGLSLDALGVITGTPRRSGVFTGIRIVATDPFGAAISSNAFSIQVLPAATSNTAPEFVAGSVFNQGILLGRAIRPIEPEFTDADNDTLGYTVIGATLPAGVTIDSATGVIRGTPGAVGWTRGLQVLATDPSGASAVSAQFWIKVE